MLLNIVFSVTLSHGVESGSGTGVFSRKSKDVSHAIHPSR
jgi:hypothetical protein